MSEDLVVDAHAHLFDEGDLSPTSWSDDVARLLPRIANPVQRHLDALLDAGRRPVLVNNVHLSALPDSRNVIRSFAALDAMRRAEPHRYGDVRLVGTVHAHPSVATEEVLAHPQVMGVRLVLHGARPDEVIDDREDDAGGWREVAARLRPDQHLHVYAHDPRVNALMIEAAPEGATLVIDHLGTRLTERGPGDPDLQHLLRIARTRGGVLFKGPGYRTGPSPRVVAPYVDAILEAVGPKMLILGATDAPHVGRDHAGRPFSDRFDAAGALDFARVLAETVLGDDRAAIAAVLHGNALRLLGGDHSDASADGEAPRRENGCRIDLDPGP